MMSNFPRVFCTSTKVFPSKLSSSSSFSFILSHHFLAVGSHLVLAAGLEAWSTVQPYGLPVNEEGFGVCRFRGWSTLSGAFHFFLPFFNQPVNLKLHIKISFWLFDYWERRSLWCFSAKGHMIGLYKNFWMWQSKLCFAHCLYINFLRLSNRHNLPDLLYSSIIFPHLHKTSPI